MMRQSFGPKRRRSEAHVPTVDETEATEVPLSINFASDEAAEFWIEKNMPALPDMGSGKDGAITKRDVRRAASTSTEE